MPTGGSKFRRRFFTAGGFFFHEDLVALESKQRVMPENSEYPLFSAGFVAVFTVRADDDADGDAAEADHERSGKGEA